jgi:xylulokinase
MEMEKYLIGLDIGTSAIKGALVSLSGEVISHGKEKIEYTYPSKEKVEFDIEKLYYQVANVISDLAKSLKNKGQITGLSIASASGNIVLLDPEMKPLMPCINWMDSRVSNEVELILGEINKQEIYELIGWPLSKRFPLAQLCYLKYHEPKILEDASKICMSTDYVLYRLTGKLVIDESTATTFFLMDQKKRVWYEPLLNSLDIPLWKLPKIYPSGIRAGTITKEAAAETGLSLETSVVLGAFDHPCAARGAGILREGQMLISCGTSWVGFYPTMNRQDAINLKMLIDPYLSPKGPWAAMFSLSAISNTVDQYICKYISSADNRYEEFDKFASLAKPTLDGLFINPLLKEVDKDIGTFSKPEISRALMEGVAFLFKMYMERHQKLSEKISDGVMVGGPSLTRPWPQILRDILDIPITSINGSFAGAVGAAILSGIGTGIYKNEEEALGKMNFPKISYKHNKELSTMYKEKYKRFLETKINP